MPSAERYFDNAATTPLDPRVFQEMAPFLQEDFGNSQSIHAWGRSAARAVQVARQRVADLIGAEDPSQVVFTSGATESNNTVLSLYDSVAISPFEHSSVREPAFRSGAHVLDNDGYDLRAAPVGGLLSVMLVNNETGAILELPPGSPRALHRDVTQAAGKILMNLDGVDYASLSAHKIGGPKGVGALYLANPVGPLTDWPFLCGGEQEDGRRAGTLNVPGIVGFGAAAAIASAEYVDRFNHAKDLRHTLTIGLAKCSDFRENRALSQSPYILSLSFLGIEAEALVLEADAQGFAISAGAACSSRSTEPSHVLTALRLEPAWLRGTIRISFGPHNSVHAADQLAELLVRNVDRLRTMGRRPT